MSRKKYMAEYYAKTRDKQLAAQKRYRQTAKYRAVSWRKYGIVDTDLAEQMFQEQKTCQICGRGPVNGKTRLSMDHDHETGQPRGMLCATCNKALGLLGDNAEGVRRALEYLED